ncbi:hypothetical protein [Bacteroides ovatus]|nr:hypothetical protein [Bacteroides ovatus]
MIHEFIRLTAVSFSSDNCQTKEQQLSDETIVRRKNNNCQTNKSMYDEY